jgi:hypothetical protein
MLSVCRPSITLEPVGRFHEIQHAGLATEDHNDVIIFNAVAQTTPKWRSFKLLRLVQKLYKSTLERFKGYVW